MNRILETIGRGLSAYLTRQEHRHSTSPPADLARLREALKPADVVLVEGTIPTGRQVSAKARAFADFNTAHKSIGGSDQSSSADLTVPDFSSGDVSDQPPTDHGR